METVDLVRYALNTATVGRAVLPALTDTLLVADKFRSAVMALCRHPGQSLSGHEANGSPCKDHQHAFWWPLDEDDDGFLDHVIVHAPVGFERHEVEALRRLTRIRQRGGRPDLLITPTYVGRDSDYRAWRPVQKDSGQPIDRYTNVFVSATPYYCPISLSRGRNSRSSRPHSIKKDIRKRLRQQQIIGLDEEVEVQEFVFDYAASELEVMQVAVSRGDLRSPLPPRQYFPVTEAPSSYPNLPSSSNSIIKDRRYRGSFVKDPDQPFTFGLCTGLCVEGGGRFVRSMAFCRRRGHHEIRAPGRMFCLTFRERRAPRPFAIGDQCHFGLGLFVPADQ